MLREASGCRITIPPYSADSNEIELAGTPDQIAKAKEEVAKLLASASTTAASN